MYSHEQIIENFTDTIIAPLAGYTTLPFRILLRKLGFKGLFFNEMINPFEIKKKRFNKLMFLKKENPIGIQLFGGYKEGIYSGAIREIQKKCHFDIVDLNMGCPVKKVIHAGGGVALLKNFSEVHKILEEVRSVWKGALSIKTRIGFDMDDVSKTIENLKTIKKYDLDFITIHFRTVHEGFETKPHIELYTDFKNELNTFIYYNGGVNKPIDIKNIKDNISPDGIMLARGILNNPLLFKNEIMGLNEKLSFAKEFIELYKKYYGEDGLRDTRKFMVYLFKGEVYSKKVRERIFAANNLKEYLLALENPYL